jgi:DNA polymerase-3 subunit delta
MLALDLLKNPSKIPIRPVYALFGDDAFLRQESLDVITQAVLGDEPDDLALTRFVGDNATLADVLDEVSTLPFLSKARIVVVDAADGFVSEHRKELETYVEHPSSTGVLILIVKTWPSNTKLAKLVEKAGLSVDCKGPDEKWLPGWLNSMAKGRHGVHLDEDAAHLLVDLIGPEPGLLASELAKLASYVGTRNSIGRADVARMVGGGRVEEVWAVIDAATTGQQSEALTLMDRLLASGEAPVRLLAAMTFSLQKVHHAGELRRRKVDARDACKRAGIFPSAVDRTLKQHAHLGPSRVSELPKMLLQADLDLKGSSSLTPRTILERLVLQLARPRQD